MVLEYLPTFTLKMTQSCRWIFQHHGAFGCVYVYIYMNRYQMVWLGDWKISQIPILWIELVDYIAKISWKIPWNSTKSHERFHQIPLDPMKNPTKSHEFPWKIPVDCSTSISIPGHLMHEAPQQSGFALVGPDASAMWPWWIIGTLNSCVNIC